MNNINPANVESGMPDEYRNHWSLFGDEIRQRISEFSAVEPDEYFYELLFCLLTPQSRAAHAEIVVARLKQAGFPEQDVDVVGILRDPSNYIRFHNQKGRRVLLLREEWDRIAAVLHSSESGEEKRAYLARHVNGLGWKEASHFLRNIGHSDLAIIDRHILKHLFRRGAIEEIPSSITPRRYLAIEEAFRNLARSYGLTLQELDLLFWSLEEGSVRK